MHWTKAVGLASACLACGTVWTAAVALACSSYAWTTRTRIDQGKGAPPELIDRIPAAWLVAAPSTEIFYFRRQYDRLGVEVIDLQIVELSLPGIDTFAAPRENRRFWRRAGWPFLALEASSTQIGGRTGVTDYGFDAPEWLERVPQNRPPWATGPPLPTRPIATGFALDSLIFAAVSFCVVLGGRAGVAAVRRRMMRCATCGYDRRGLSSPEGACPECGMAPTT
jgi:hypothetical protein